MTKYIFGSGENVIGVDVQSAYFDDIDLLINELKKRDKGIERLKRRRDELVQALEMDSRIKASQDEAIEEIAKQRDELLEQVGMMADEISELLKKQPYTFDVNDVRYSIRLIGKYIDELHTRLDNRACVSDDILSEQLRLANNRIAALERRIKQLEGQKEYYRELFSEMSTSAHEMLRIAERFGDA